MENDLKIIETFLSIQGEGIHSGLPTYFVRLAGCNLRCSFCDTTYSYGQGENRTVKEIVAEIKKQGFKRVCITGGEPLLQKNVKYLIEELVANDYQVDIETNGSVLITCIDNSPNILFSLDIKSPSSGMHEKMNYDNLGFLEKKDQVKFIISDKNDYEFAKGIINQYNLSEKTNIIFTPTGGIQADNIVKWILRDNIDVRIGLQIHKVIWKSEREELNLV